MGQALSVLVTGGAGFIGSHVVAGLCREGHRVTVVDNLSSGKAEQVPSPARLLVGDVRWPEAWAAQLGALDAVIHLAAQVSVARAEADPAEDAEVNLVGTLRMLQLAHAKGAREFRLASSAAVYGTPAAVPVREDAPVRPGSFYGLSKAAAEAAAGRFAAVQGLRLVTLRIANCYGPRQRAEGEGGVVAVFADRMARGQAPEIHGDGRQVRDFIFVEDVARAFGHRLGESPSVTVNIATGVAATVLEVWQALAVRLAPSGLAQRFGPRRPGDIDVSVLDPERARQWGFVAATSLAVGLDATADYFARAAGRS